MPTKHTIAISTDNGNQVVCGLNLMAAIVCHPAANIIHLAVFQDLHEINNDDIKEMMNAVKAALEFIEQINKTTASCEPETPQPPTGEPQ